MIELEENKRQLLDLNKRVESIGESLWLKRDRKQDTTIRTKNYARRILEW